MQSCRAVVPTSCEHGSPFKQAPTPVHLQACSSNTPVYLSCHSPHLFISRPQLQSDFCGHQGQLPGHSTPGWCPREGVLVHFCDSQGVAPLPPAITSSCVNEHYIKLCYLELTAQCGCVFICSVSCNEGSAFAPQFLCAALCFGTGSTLFCVCIWIRGILSFYGSVLVVCASYTSLSQALPLYHVLYCFL